MKMSKSSLQSADGDATRREDAVSLIYRLIREHAVRRRVHEVTWADINAVVAKHTVTVRGQGPRGDRGRQVSGCGWCALLVSQGACIKGLQGLLCFGASDGRRTNI